MITNHKGEIINLLNLELESICLEDIVMALPNICRYGGRTPKFYSVAQHAIELSRYLHKVGMDHLRPLALLHDAPEAYIGDLIYPIKKLYPEFLEMEDTLSNLFYQKFNVDLDLKDHYQFDYYDKNIVVNEMKVLGIWEKEKALCSHLEPLPHLEITEIFDIDLSREMYKKELNLVLNLDL
jgi:hypothetical protein